MNRKVTFTIIVITVLIIISIPAGFLYVLNNGNPYTKLITSHYVPSYLEEKGYTEKDILDSHFVEPKHLINQDVYHGHYMVIFKDEPTTTYYYGVTKRGKKVVQFCEKDVQLSDGTMNISTERTMHSEEECLQSLENR
ncbi:DUF3139 domain-containing protein [Neobacillus notoginsengisoli]|uniref:DUF3139 domain-containing protein n=1 Tax=Neobacillus notoginsengisoli TaxID=1578198 RepID=A0A417YV39_9BACI|nr:DUF3139 domain-containing protein [Neobacillus notoginsengisoli]RHW41164.1 DUF3139 domain-containing protein [Neobacillus notoginsengisoli]